jgi:hypothetical protein
MKMGARSSPERCAVVVGCCKLQTLLSVVCCLAVGTVGCSGVGR